MRRVRPRSTACARSAHPERTSAWNPSAGGRRRIYRCPPIADVVQRHGPRVSGARRTFQRCEADRLRDALPFRLTRAAADAANEGVLKEIPRWQPSPAEERVGLWRWKGTLRCAEVSRVIRDRHTRDRTSPRASAVLRALRTDRVIAVVDTRLDSRTEERRQDRTRYPGACDVDVPCARGHSPGCSVVPSPTPPGPPRASFAAAMADVVATAPKARRGRSMRRKLVGVTAPESVRQVAGGVAHDSTTADRRGQPRERLPPVWSRTRPTASPGHPAPRPFRGPISPALMPSRAAKRGTKSGIQQPDAPMDRFAPAIGAVRDWSAARAKSRLAAWTRSISSRFRQHSGQSRGASPGGQSLTITTAPLISTRRRAPQRMQPRPSCHAGGDGYRRRHG